MKPWSLLSESPNRNRITSILIPIVILMVGLATVTTSCADPDLWGHVQYGREVLRDGILPATATWTFAAEGAAWVNHENIAELLLALTVDNFGAAALPWMKLLLAALIFGLIIVSSRTSGANWLAIAIVVTLVAANIRFHWHFRPQILTYTSLAVMLAVWQYVFAHFQTADDLRRDTSKGRLKWLWLLPPLMCFWANSHGGFAAGLAILFAYHGLICLQLWWHKGWSAWPELIHLTLVTMASAAATLLNPYGFGLWKFMLDALRLPRPEISDWGPLALWTGEAAQFWSLMVVVAISLVFDRSRLRSSQLIIMALLCWQGLSHCRHLSIFAIVCGFWIPQHLHHVLDSAGKTLTRLQPCGREEHTAVSPLLLSTLLILSLFRLVPHLKSVSVNRSEYPVAAMQFLHDQQLRGKIVVTFNWAQYAIGCFAADNRTVSKSRVAVDGRFETCYPREITDIYFDFWLGTADPSKRYRSASSSPFDPAAALEFHEPDLVLLSREQRPSVRTIAQHRDDWVLLYQDGLAQVWGRRSKFGDPHSPLFVPEFDRSIGDSTQQGELAWPAFPTDRSGDERLTLKHRIEPTLERRL